MRCRFNFSSTRPPGYYTWYQTLDNCFVQEANLWSKPGEYHDTDFLHLFTDSRQLAQFNPVALSLDTCARTTYPTRQTEIARWRRMLPIQGSPYKLGPEPSMLKQQGTWQKKKSRHRHSKLSRGGIRCFCETPPSERNMHAAWQRPAQRNLH